MKVKFFGGVGTIGGNCFLVESADGSTRILLDFGMNFSKESGEPRYFEQFLQPRSYNELKDLLALNLLPRIPGIYRDDLLNLPDPDSALAHCEDLCDYEEARAKNLWFIDEPLSYDRYCKTHGRGYLDAVLITHEHLDHIKYVKFLAPEIPVYLSPVTQALVEACTEVSDRAEERHIVKVKPRVFGRVRSGSNKGAPRVSTKDSQPISRNIIALANGESLPIGRFQVTAYDVDHSIPGALAFLIHDQSNNTRLVYTGDFRFHGYRGTISEAFQSSLVELGEKIQAVICEGTHIEDRDFRSEDQVREELIRKIRETAGLFCVSFHWKNVFRYQTLKQCARETGRTLVVSGKLAHLVNCLSKFPELAIQPLDGANEVKIFFPRKNSGIYHKYDYSKNSDAYQNEFQDRGIYPWHLHAHPDQYILHLTYWDLQDLIDIFPDIGLPGSRYVISSISPFEEEMELSERRLRNWLELFGLLEPDTKPEYIHASGHASGPEIIEFLQAIQPGIVFPVHTLNPELFDEEKIGTRVIQDLVAKNSFEILPDGTTNRIPDFVP